MAGGLGTQHHSASIVALIFAICSCCIFTARDDGGRSRRRGRCRAGRRRHGISSAFFVLLPCYASTTEIKPQPGCASFRESPLQGDWAEGEGGGGGGGPSQTEPPPSLGGAGRGGEGRGGSGYGAGRGGGAEPGTDDSYRPSLGRTAPPTASATSRKAQDAAPSRRGERQAWTLIPALHGLETTSGEI